MLSNRKMCLGRHHNFLYQIYLKGNLCVWTSHTLSYFLSLEISREFGNASGRQLTQGLRVRKGNG